jgi:hypothetical protein
MWYGPVPTGFRLYGASRAPLPCVLGEAVPGQDVAVPGIEPYEAWVFEHHLDRMRVKVEVAAARLAARHSMHPLPQLLFLQPHGALAYSLVAPDRDAPLESCRKEVLVPGWFCMACCTFCTKACNSPKFRFETAQ